MPHIPVAATFLKKQVYQVFAFSVVHVGGR